jgi:hypothetical protein
MKRAELDGLDREALIRLAESHGISRPRILTRPELIDELLLRTADGDAGAEVSIARGFFGLARDLVARVVERGLHLPDAATKIRALHLEPPRGKSTPPAGLPTVTLAQIYAAQGHTARAKDTLLRVLALEPEHTEARELLDRLSHPSYVPPAPPLPPEEEAARERAEAAVKASAPADEASPVARDETENINDVEGLGDGAASAEEALVAAVEDDAEAPAEPAIAEATSAEPAIAEATSAEPAVVEAASAGAREPAPPTPPLASEAPVATPSASSEPPEVPAMLDDAPLPPKYDVDECVAIPVDPETLFAYWEVREALLAKVAEARGEGVLALRALVVEPGWHGPRTWSRDHDVFSPVGDYFLRELPKGAVVRVAIGYRTATAFVPLAHSPLLALPRREPSDRLASALVRWTPDGVVPVGEGDLSAGGAMQRALRRVEEKGGGDEALAALLGLPELARFEGREAQGSSHAAATSRRE